MGKFWERRVRRLLPAAFVTVAAWLVPQVLDVVAAHAARLEVPVSTEDAGQ